MQTFEDEMNNNQQSSTSAISSERLNRIEDKIDKLSETVVSLARVEEKLLSLERSNQCIISRTDNTRQDLDAIDTRITQLEVSMGGFTKIIWYIISAVVSALVFGWFTLKK